MEKLCLDEFKSYRFLSDLKWSPDGKFAAFAASYANDDNGYDSGIYLYDPAAGTTKRLTTLGKEKSFVWQDDENILFSSMRSEKYKKQVEGGTDLTVYYRISVKGGEAEEAFVIPLKATAIRLTGGDNIVISAAFDNAKTDLSALSGEEKENAVKAAKEEKDYEVVDELPWWSNGAGFTNKKRTRLYLYNTVSKAVTAITGPLFQTNGFQLSPCKNFIVYFGFLFENLGTRKTGLYLYNIATGENTTLLAPDYVITQADFLKKDTVVFAGSDQKAYGIATNPWFYTFDIPSGKLALLAEYDGSVCSNIASDCRLGGGISFKVYGGDLYFTEAVDYNCNLSKLTADGKITRVIDEAGTVDCFDIAEKGIVYIGMMGQRLQELYIFDAATNEKTRITSLNESVYADRYVAVPQHFSFVEADGFTIDGWVLLPYGYEKGKKYPAIFDIHGGPKSAFGEVFYHEMQYWAGQGYFVLFCNPRGGDGKGNAFADVRGKYGTFDYDNLMQFVDLCIEKYADIDVNNIGVTGGSYGGFMTNWIIGHTNRFKAAASQRSISNWISFCGTSDIGFIFGEDQMAANIWSDSDKLWWHSPLRYADKATTPTLFVHSDQDYRCWIPEGYQMFTALKLKGVETRMCVFHGENHELSRSGKPLHRARRLKEITNWFDERLK